MYQEALEITKSYLERSRLPQIQGVRNLKGLASLGKKGITSLRGKEFPIIIHNQEIIVVPVIHPANLLYNGRSPVILEQMKQDFQTIKKIIEKKGAQKSLGEF